MGATPPTLSPQTIEARTDRLFWVAPYQTRATARVLTAEGNHVELDQTIFFAFSGVQESERGLIAGHEARETTLLGQRIRYTPAEMPATDWLYWVFLTCSAKWHSGGAEQIAVSDRGDPPWAATYFKPAARRDRGKFNQIKELQSAI